jgi:hypothetical protein
MLDRLLIEQVWLALALWAALYVSDYNLTIRAAQMYQRGVKEIFVFEGSYELTPYYQQDIDSLRWFSPRFGAALVLSLFAIAVVWHLAVRVAGRPELYLLLVGGLILLELSVHIRHVRNLVTFHYASGAPGRRGITGRIEYPRWLLLRFSAVEVMSFAALYFILFLVTGNWFLLGGAAFCLGTGLRHQIWSGRIRPA